jgi:hypothetical protein
MLISKKLYDQLTDVINLRFIFGGFLVIKTSITSVSKKIFLIWIMNGIVYFELSSRKSLMAK